MDKILKCKFNIEIEFEREMNGEDLKDYYDWKKKNPNEFPVNLLELKKDIFDGIDDIESKRKIIFSNLEHEIVDKSE